MTSQRQQRQEQYDHIGPFIQKSADEHYGSNLDRRFRHWAFSTIFAAGHDLGENDIDGSDDFEIDKHFIPESDDDSVVNQDTLKGLQERSESTGYRILFRTCSS